jgi:hypothetical protein
MVIVRGAGSARPQTMRCSSSGSLEKQVKVRRCELLGLAILLIVSDGEGGSEEVLKGVGNGQIGCRGQAS